MLRAWLASRFPSGFDLDDIVQESFVRILRARENGEIRSPKAFLFATARTLALDHARMTGVYSTSDAEILDILDESVDFDLSLEAYLVKDVVGSIGVFQKNIKKFLRRDPDARHARIAGAIRPAGGGHLRLSRAANDCERQRRVYCEPQMGPFLHRAESHRRRVLPQTLRSHHTRLRAQLARLLQRRGLHVWDQGATLNVTIFPEHRWVGRFAAFLAFWGASASAGAAKPVNSADFFFRDGDRIVVAGDSITVEGGYVRYIENFLRTRFPDWTILVRNAGTNGEIAQGGLAYMDRDVLAWKPTAVLVNYGMNDGRRGGAALYKEGIVPYVEKLIASGVRVVLCSNSPVDIGDRPGQFTGFNVVFDEMARFAEQFAAEKGIPFVDQFHFCHSVWGLNRTRAEPVPVSHQTRVPYSSDFVHARGPGQLTMAYIILKTLGAPGEVSAASIRARSGESTTRRCTIQDLRTLPGGEGVTFVRADRASPCWIDEQEPFPGALGLKLVPFMAEMNRMPLQVTELAEGHYELRIEGQACGTFSASELAAGIDLAANRQSPVYGPGRKADAKIKDQRVGTYAARQVGFFNPPVWLEVADLEQQKATEFARRRIELEKQDETIAEAARPRPLRYELRRVGGEKS